MCSIALIDDGELDWKVLAISLQDPLAASLFRREDVESKLPHVLSGIKEWFRWYKTPDNKPLNAFGFDEKWLDENETRKVIEETHNSWSHLIKEKGEGTDLWVPTESS